MDDSYLLARQIIEEARRLGCPVEHSSSGWLNWLGAGCVVDSLYIYVQIDLLLERINVWAYHEKGGPAIITEVWYAPLTNPNAMSRAAVRVLEISDAFERAMSEKELAQPG